MQTKDDAVKEIYNSEPIKAEDLVTNLAPVIIAHLARL